MIEGIYNKDFIFSRNDATDIKINGVLYEDYMTCTVPDAEK